MSTFEVFCSLFFFRWILFLCWLLGFILESRITIGVFYSFWLVVSIGLMEAHSVVVLGVRIQFNLSSTRG